MSILDDYMQLQMIDNVKKIKEMELCYKSNLKLCKQQEKQINKLATAIEKIKKIAEENYDLLQGYHKEWANNKLILQICDEVNQCEN